MRNRRLTWILATLLSLGALQAVPPVRTAPFAEVRTVACLLLRDTQREQPAADTTDLPDPLIVVRPDFEARNANAWLESPFRFQRPPPAFAA